MYLLDLDKYRSINELNIQIDTRHQQDTINKLINIVKTHGTNRGIIYHDTGDVQQYCLQIKYLNMIFEFAFEFDVLAQYILIVLYNNLDVSKIYLKLRLAINDDPIIQYIENDHSGFINGYSNNNIKLKPGECIINLVHCLLNFIGYSRVRLDDNSQLVRVNNNNLGSEQRTKLWLYLLLTKGKSWYSKFGYEPHSANQQEIQLKINDIKAIKIDQIVSIIKSINMINNLEHINETLLSVSDNVYKLIGHIHNQTLGEYINECSLENFTILTNNLTQSVFSKKYIIAQSEVSFFWFDLFQQLFVLNVMQINNNISKYFYRIVD